MARWSCSRLSQHSSLVEDVLLEQRVERLHGGVVRAEATRPIDPLSPFIASTRWKLQERKGPPRSLWTTTVPLGLRRASAWRRAATREIGVGRGLRRSRRCGWRRRL